MRSLSQQFYSNINDIKHVFINASSNLRAEILNSDIEYSLKVILINYISKNYFWNVLDLISDSLLAIKLSYACDSKDYVKYRFNSIINDKNFNEFYKILENNFAINFIGTLEFNLFNNCYKQKIFDLVSKLDEELFSSFLNNLNSETQNYFCSKNPAIIKKIQNGRGLTGRNKYRHTVHLLLTNSCDKYKYNNKHIGVIKSLVKYYPIQLINNFQKIYSNSLILFLIENREIEIAKKAYGLLDDNQKDSLNCDGFAFFINDFDLNLLNLHQLRSNIEYCYDDKVLLEAISKVNKAKILELFEYNLCIDKYKAEKILLTVFSIDDVIKICAVNEKFARKVIFLITNEQILRQFSSYKWFWGVFHYHHFRNLEGLCDLLLILDKDILLSHINVFNHKIFRYMFHYFYQIDTEFAFKLFELYRNRQLGIILDYKYLLQDFIDRYGIDYIISLEDNEVSKRMQLLEQLPLNYAVYMCNKLKLKIGSDELSRIHRGRFKALLKRINVDYS